MASLLRRTVKKLAAPTVRHIPLAVYRRLYPRSPLGFFYHVVSDERLPHVRHLYPFKSRADFEADLLWLKTNTTLIGYDELSAYVHGRAALPPNAAYLSFDDGFRECYDVVRPLLLKHGIPCTFFLTTDWIDNRRLFFRSKISLIRDALGDYPPDDRAETIRKLATAFDAPADEARFNAWLKAHKEAGEGPIDGLCARLGIDPDGFLAEQKPYLTSAQILEMQAEGFVFGAHTLDHTKLIQLQPEEQARQIVESCRAVAELTGADQVPFAFPFSGDGVSRELLSGLQAQHTQIGLIFDTKKLRLEPGVLHRIWADRPAPEIPAEENLSFWLHDAYRRLIVE